MHNFCFVFSHYSNNPWTIQNYKALINVEGARHVFPVSRFDHGLPNSTSFNDEKILYGFDTAIPDCSHKQCDALLYHWVLKHKKQLRKYKMIMFIESDVYWGIPMKKLFNIKDLKDNSVYSCWLEPKNDRWYWMQGDVNKHPYSEHFFGITIGAIWGFSSSILLKMTERFFSDINFRDLAINELRSGTLANMCGASFNTFPKEICGCNFWGEWAVHTYKGKGIFHPVKFVSEELKHE